MNSNDHYPAVLELEFELPEPIDIGTFSYDFLDLTLLYSKLSLIAQHKYEQLYFLNDLPYRRRLSEFSRDEKLFVISLSKNSPTKIKVGSWIPKAIEALTEMIERLCHIPEKRDRAKLENEAFRVEVALKVLDKLELNNLSESQRIALANELLYDIRKVANRNKRMRVLNFDTTRS